MRLDFCVVSKQLEKGCEFLLLELLKNKKVLTLVTIRVVKIYIIIYCIHI